MAEFKGLKGQLLIVDDQVKPVTLYDLNIPEWQKTYADEMAKFSEEVMAKMAKHIAASSWTFAASEPVKLDPEIEAALPDICRRAAKRIADQPQLWCKGAFHRTYGLAGMTGEPQDWQGQPVALDALPNKQQACAMGHIEDILVEDYGKRAEQAMTPASNLINEASTKAVGVGVPQVNDNPEATPDTIADHLFVVADELEFGNGS